MDIHRIFVTLTILITILASNSAISLTDEKRLIKHLLENYEQVGLIGRPVFNVSDTVKIQFGLALIQILDLDEHSQVLTTRSWLRYAWHDVFLKWKPEDFGGVDHIRIPITKIWSPDIFLYNSVESPSDYESNLHNGGAMAVASSDGNVMWIPTMNFKSTCSLDFSFFPHDTQLCTFKIGSWTYDGFRMDVDFYDNLEEFDLTDYIQSNEWEILETKARKNVKYYPCCDEPYPDLTFQLKIKRISAGNQYALIIPTALLSILTLVMFCIPPVMDAKINLGSVIFLGCFFMLHSIKDLSPPGGAALSRLTQYLSVEIILVTMAIICSTLTMNLARKGKRGIALPELLKTIFNNCIGKSLCVCAPSKASIVETASPEEKVGFLLVKNEKDQDWETFATILDRIFFIIFTILTFIFVIVLTY